MFNKYFKVELPEPTAKPYPNKMDTNLHRLDDYIEFYFQVRLNNELYKFHMNNIHFHFEYRKYIGKKVTLKVRRNFFQLFKTNEYDIIEVFINE